MKCKDCGNTRPAIPGFPNHVLCDYYHLHMSNIADANRCEHFKPKVITNADRIRAMSDEELARLFADDNCGYCHIHDFCFAKGCQIDCENMWLDWLKAPVEEGDNGT